ncbi:MAG: heterodisulfide reductase-related iron-sulfur binding cluster [Acidimicrobiales bacterium]
MIAASLAASAGHAPGPAAAVLGVVATRKIFGDMGGPVAMGVFYLLSTVVIITFFYGWWRRIKKYNRGRSATRKVVVGQAGRVVGQAGAVAGQAGAARSGRLPSQLSFWKGVGRVAGNTTVKKRDRKVGHAHAMVFWGFILLFVATSIVSFDYDIVRNITLVVVGHAITFFHGPFYMGFNLVFNAAGLMTIVGLVFLMVRRAEHPVPQLDYARAEKPDAGYSRRSFVQGDWLFVGLLLAILATGFIVQGLRIDASSFPAFERWTWLGYLVGMGFAASGVGAGAARITHEYMWWVHSLMALGFVAYVPYSKAMHIWTAGADVVVTDPSTSRSLPPSSAGSDHIGYKTLADFTWKELLDLDACTKCGRCHAACPARTAGGPLSPRDLVLDLRQWADRTTGIRDLLDWEERPDRSGPALGAGAEEVAGDVVKAKTLWSCTTCMACVEACPVGIEHVPVIIQLRRRLVDRGDMEQSLQDALQNIAQQGNSFGKSARMRSRWTKGLDFQVPDARKQHVQHLWFVGDYASFDERLQGLSRMLATVLHDSGVDFGILADGERNAGNDVRRVGEEGLFEMLVEHNMASMAQASFDQVFTTDPHSLNTLRNEYPSFGFDKLVLHYTELLAELLAAGQIRVGRLGAKVTYHDPCYLGRYNRIFDAPRSALSALGCDLVEMPRNRENSFCCGAGGGRIWMDDSYLEERPSENRIREAVSLGVDRFIVACPKDYAMYSAAVQATGNESRIKVYDMIELVNEAMQPATAAAGAP